MASQPSSVSVPGLSRATTTEILRAPRSDRPARTLTSPDVNPASAPSFYFIDEQLPISGPRTTVPTGACPDFDVEAVRRDFPILRERIHGRQLVWLDNGATTQKPQVVIDRLANFYAHENSNIHRSAHTLAARATDAYEGARAKVADFLGAPSAADVVFTRGTTEAINLIAQSCGNMGFGPDDEIVISHL
jgi:cysteine desulfurase/selenocysteine lyase